MSETTTEDIELADREDSDAEDFPNATEDKLVIRKKCELEIIAKYDRTAVLLGKDCWYIMDTNWLNAWSNFVNGGEDIPAPGPVSGKDLLDVNGNPLPGLKARIDYRGVSPLIYFIFVELYGKDPNVPDICRYTIDIYQKPVPVEKLIDVSFRALNKAKIKVNKIRPKWMEWERQYDDDEDEVKEGCCGLTKEHLEAIIYWMVTCCRRRSAGRADISYRAYKPLRNNLEDEEEGEEKKEGDGNEEDEDVPKTQKKKSRVRAAASAAASAASAVASAPRVVFNLVRNNLTIQQEKKEQQQQQQANGGKVRTKREARLAARQHKDDLIDESDGDYENMHWGVADKEHEKGTWISASVSSSMHGMQRN